MLRIIAQYELQHSKSRAMSRRRETRFYESTHARIVYGTKGRRRRIMKMYDVAICVHFSKERGTLAPMEVLII